MATSTRKTSRTKSIKVDFVVDKDTKNTRRFSEVPKEGEEPVITTLYVQKSAFGGNLPDAISVTITPS